MTTTRNQPDAETIDWEVLEFARSIDHDWYEDEENYSTTWARSLSRRLAQPAPPTRSQLMEVFLSVNLLSRPLLINAMIEAGLAVEDGALAQTGGNDDAED